MEIRQLTFLRFIAASAVVVFHAGGHVPSLAWGSGLWEHANTAVSFFFLLSGFILAYVYQGRGIQRPMDFYRARFARIVPLYWLALLLSAAYELYKRPFDPAAGLLSVLGLQAWVPGYALVLNSPGWSLSVELFFYLVFPFLIGWLLKVRRESSLVILMLVVWVANQVLHVALLNGVVGNGGKAWQQFASYHPLMHASTFVVGAISGLLFVVHREDFRRMAIPLIVCAVAGLAAMLLISNPLVTYHHNGLLAPLFVMLLWGLGSAPDLRISRWLSHPALVLLGEASYGIYILQLPVQIAHAPVAQRFHLGSEAYFWSYYVLLIVVSVVCFRSIEVPLREWIKSGSAASRSGALKSST